MENRRVPIGEKGQIVIPVRMRRAFGLELGKIVILEEREDGIMLKPEPDPRAFVEGFVSAPKKPPSMKSPGEKDSTK